jgi:hypothetical protein
MAGLPSGVISPLNQRFLALVCLLGVTGFAFAQIFSTASTGTTPQPVTSSSPSPTTPAAAAMIFKPPSQQGRPSDDLMKRARRSGYAMKTKSGNYFFCKEEAAVGTRLATERCFAPDDFALLLERQEHDKDQIRQMTQGLNGAGH